MGDKLDDYRKNVHAVDVAGSVFFLKGVIPVIAVILLCILFGCSRQKSGGAGDADGDTVPLRYAKNLLMIRHADYVEVKLRNPWRQGEVLHSYCLIGHEDSAKAKSIIEKVNDRSTTVVYVPLRKAVSFNTAHASLMQMLGATDQLKGVADLKYMLLPEIRKRVSDGVVVDCGDSMSPDIEKIVEAGADAILLSPFENSGGYGSLEKIGIPIIECAEYMETSALGRAEWMRFYGMLLGKEHEAETLFAKVDSSYQAQRAFAAKAGKGLSLLTERLTGNTWYIAGGQSSVGRLIADANGGYAWSADSHSGSLALSFETVLDKSGDADVWIFNYNGSKPLRRQMLLDEYHGYGRLKAYQTRQIWYVNTLLVPYFEEVSFRPDFLLRDYIILLHPGLLDDVPRYYKRLVE